jgi:sigma-B regulation protein RsbU (phosphoserine phosphatase)
MNETQLRVTYSAIALASVAWLVLATVVFVLRPDRHSDDTAWSVEDAGGRTVLIVESITRGGVADIAGVRKGDRVVAIDGHDVTPEILKRSSGQELLDNAPAGAPVSYVVERDGVVLPLTIVLHDDDRRAGAFTTPLFYVFTFLWLAIGTMVVLAQPRGRVQRAFFLTAATSAFAFCLPTIAGAAFGNGTVPALVLVGLQTMTGSLFFSFWIYFCSLFPIDQNLFRNAYGKSVLAIPPALMMVVLITRAIFELTNQSQIVAAIAFGLSVGVMLLVDVLYFVGGIVLLYRGYKRLAPTAERRSMRVILAGAVLTSGALLYLPVLGLFPNLGIDLGVALLIPMTLILALPVSFGYAIFKYQVMDFRSVVKTTLVYLATMALVGGMYLGVAYGLSLLFGAFIEQRFKESIEAGIFVLSLLLFDPLKRQLQTAIENRFFPQHRDYSSHLADFAVSVERSVSVAAIVELIATTLSETVALRNVVVASMGSGDNAVTVAKVADEEASRLDAAALGEIAAIVERSHGIVSLEVVDDENVASLRSHFGYAAGLFAQGRLVGIVLFSRPGGDGSLRARQVQFVNSIATQGAAALEVARLYEEELARQRYDEQLAAARHIQQSLLTTDVPALPGLSVSVAAHSAQAVGGDYFRVIRLDASRVLVIVADVSGKGLPASLYMAQLHGMVCIVGATCTTPAEMLTTINDHLFAEMARGTFVTAAVLLFDSSRGIMHYARAGHTPILVRTKSGLRSLAPRGLALGIVPSQEFLRHLEERSLRLETGDTFILYSDGVSEAMNGHRELFDDTRLMQAIDRAGSTTTDGICDAILDGVDAFRDGAEQNDDVTLVVLRVEADAAASVAPEPAPEAVAVA